MDPRAARRQSAPRPSALRGCPPAAPARSGQGQGPSPRVAAQEPCRLSFPSVKWAGETHPRSGNMSGFTPSNASVLCSPQCPPHKTRGCREGARVWRLPRGRAQGCRCRADLARQAATWSPGSCPPSSSECRHRLCPLVWLRAPSVGPALDKGTETGRVGGPNVQPQSLTHRRADPPRCGGSGSPCGEVDSGEKGVSGRSWRHQRSPLAPSSHRAPAPCVPGCPVNSRPGRAPPCSLGLQGSLQNPQQLRGPVASPARRPVACLQGACALPLEPKSEPGPAKPKPRPPAAPSC